MIEVYTAPLKTILKTQQKSPLQSDAFIIILLSQIRDLPQGSLWFSESF